MIPNVYLPLAQVRFSLRDHRAALWWLGILYRRPDQLRQELEGLRKRKALIAGAILYLHVFPYIVLLATLSSLVVVAVLGEELILFHLIRSTIEIVFGIAFGIAFGIVYGIVFGIAFGIALGIAVAIALGIGFGFHLGFVPGPGGEFDLGIAVGISVGMAGIIAGIGLGTVLDIAAARRSVRGIVLGRAGSAYRIAYGIASGIAYGIAFGIAGGIVYGIGNGIGVLRAYYHACHLFFIWPRPKGHWYRFHPVAWDDLCALPFPRLDRLLVAHAEQEPDAGYQEIERLITTYPSQRMEALRARTVLLARQAERETRLSRLDGIIAKLPEGEQGFLAQTPKLKEMIAEICRQQQRLEIQERPLFREPIAALLCKEIENFRYRISGFYEPLASEFRAAAQRWLTIAQHQHNDATAVLARQPTPQVFRAGDPVDRRQEAFVLRAGVVENLERQLMLSTGCPGLILYGRRRMGKSTLLKNLDGFLPPSVRVITVRMQNPEVFTSMGSFLDLVTQMLRAVRSGEKRPGPADLSGFFKVLNECNERLESKQERLLLALDEYEYIDRKIGEGAFSEDLLATLRESIQSHRQITWILAGSYEIPELTHAPWSSYLVSVRTLEVPPFTETETRLLLTDPLKHSPVWDRDDPKRPRFDPGFWGDASIGRIHNEAGGWPHLVQLLAETTVDLLNNLGEAQVNATLLERAIHEAITLGDVVLRQLMHPENARPAEWDYLRGFRTRETQRPPDNERVYQALRRRLLVSETNGEWRLRVPLLQRWLRQRG